MILNFGDLSIIFSVSAAVILAFSSGFKKDKDILKMASTYVGQNPFVVKVALSNDYNVRISLIFLIISFAIETVDTNYCLFLWYPYDSNYEVYNWLIQLLLVITLSFISYNTCKILARKRLIKILGKIYEPSFRKGKFILVNNGNIENDLGKEIKPEIREERIKEAKERLDRFLLLFDLKKTDDPSKNILNLENKVFKIHTP